MAVGLLGVGAVLRLLWLDAVPPGLHFDEAVYGLLARDIYAGRYPIFFSSYTGREPLYMYLMALVYHAIGVNAVAIRLTSALIGLATLPILYLLGREMFSWRVGLLAMALLALSYWHLTVSRNGYPNILIPPLGGLSFYFLWRGYRGGRWLDFVLGGFLAGAILYTYLAARFFPLTLIAIFFYALLVDRDRVRKRLRGILLAGAVAVLTFTPLGLHFLTHPRDFWERARQVLAFGEASGLALVRLLWFNTVQTAGGFLLRGDPRWHFNLPNKPVFGPLLGFFFLLGLFVALRRWRRVEYGALPIWVAVMSLPAILTAELMPASQRTFGVIPALYLLPALGLDAAWRGLESKGLPRLSDLDEKRRFRRVGAFKRDDGLRTKIGLAGLVALLAWEGASTYHAYFNDWARQIETYYIFNADYVEIARQAPGPTAVILSEHYKHPTVVFLAPQSLQAVWTLGDKALPFPARDSEIVYFLPTSSLSLDSPAAKILARMAHEITYLPAPDGQPAVVLYRVHPSRFPAAEGAGLTFNGEVELLEAEVPSLVRRDEPLHLAIHWRVVKSVAQGRTWAVHLVDDDGFRWAQADQMGYLSEQWRPGDRVIQWFRLPLDPTMPAGPYRLRLILSDEAANPLPVLDVQGMSVGLFADLGPVVVSRQGGLRQPIARGKIRWGNLQIIAHDPPAVEVAPGGRVALSITWQAVAQIERSHLRVVIELVDGQGRVWARYTRPLAHRYPPSAWDVGEVVQARYAITLPADAPPGESVIRFGVEGLEGWLPLGTIRVRGQERLFQVPPIENPLTVVLVEGARPPDGGAIELLGYDLPERTFRAGGTIPLILYWRARAPVQGHYKVFTHLLDGKGRIWGQQDSVPGNWQRPTQGWVQGEVIVDPYRIPIHPGAPTGRYLIEVGMYDPQTMRRLAAYDGTGNRLSDDRVLLAPVEVRGP